MAKKARATDKILTAIKTWGLALPGAHEKAPWPGHNDLAVKDKTFAYLSTPGEPFGVGCKLPQSSHVALMLPFAEPMAYGLGKSGWVSATFPDDNIDIDMVKAWILESYRAQAPKKLVAQLDGGTPAPAAPKQKSTKTRKRSRR